MGNTETKWFKCSDCGRAIPDWEAYERNGSIFGICCMLKTAARRAYEKWFVEPNS